ncbi:hypothetical protein DFH28DRAFT_1130128 [Melampsora americana]|nr:hypothetical protein DFH28DRAFT_1130128 [Melampsora americana]
MVGIALDSAAIKASTLSSEADTEMNKLLGNLTEQTVNKLEKVSLAFMSSNDRRRVQISAFKMSEPASTEENTFRGVP